MSEDRPSYVYRVERADAPRLRALIAEHVVGDVWVGGGAAHWDFDPHLGKKNLREIVKIPADATPALTDEHLKGDFGHAFSRAAELRWKRRDDGDYDVLVLSEAPLAVDGATPLCVPRWNSTTQAWEDGGWTIRDAGEALIWLDGDQRAIRYIDYLAPNGAVQFQRLVEMVEP